MVGKGDAGFPKKIALKKSGRTTADHSIEIIEYAELKAYAAPT
jgi:hypothetical protein